LWLRNRLASLGVSWSIGQILTGKASILGIAGIGLSSVMSLLRGQLPYKKVAGALGVEFRTKVESIIADSKRTLEDLKIPYAEESEEELAKEPKLESKGWGLIGLGAALEAVARQVTRRQPEDEILEQLRGDIERLGQKNRPSRVWFRNFIHHQFASNDCSGRYSLSHLDVVDQA